MEVAIDERHSIMKEGEGLRFAGRPGWSGLPLRYIIDHAARRKTVSDVRDVAASSWNITQDEQSLSRAAFYLPGQTERIRGTAYTGDIKTEVEGGVVESQKGVKAYLVKDAVLLDGCIYKSGACSWIGPRQHRIPRLGIGCEIRRGVAYGSFNGSSFFGMWLLDDCATYRLSENDGVPLSMSLRPSAHILEYEALLGMNPVRTYNAYVRELVLYDDLYQTRDKRRRARLNTARLLSRFPSVDHPGAFILRRDTGVARVLENEIELAEYLHARRGFRIVDITTMSASEILSACSGARVIAGVEGSHLVHGLMVLREGRSVLTLQPPDRFCTCLKRVADPDGQNFGFVVGTSTARGFYVDPVEVEKTLDLFPS